MSCPNARSLRKARDVIMAATSPIRLAGNRREADASTSTLTNLNLKESKA